MLRNEAAEDFALGKRSLLSAPWVQMEHDSEPVLLDASEKAEMVADGVGKLSWSQMQRAIAHLLRGNA